MKSIEQFNMYLNTSLGNDFKVWSSYKEKVKEQLRFHFSHVKKFEDALVIGFGNGEDIPLKMLINKFNTITITDIDIKSVKKGVSKQDLMNNELKKLSFIQMDYTGFEDFSFFEILRKRLNNQESVEEIANWIYEILNQVKFFHWKKQLKTKYDLIFVSPIYTQLIYQQFLSIIKKYPIFEELNEKFLQHMITIIDNFNDNLVSILKDEGIIFVLSDIFEDVKNSQFINQVMEAMSDPDQMHFFHLNYINNFGYGFGDYGLLSLEKRTLLLDEKWLIWPFSEEKEMVVKLEVLKNIVNN